MRRLASVFSGGILVGVFGAAILIMSFAMHDVNMESFALGILIAAGSLVAGSFVFVVVLSVRDGYREEHRGRP